MFLSRRRPYLPALLLLVGVLVFGVVLNSARAQEGGEEPPPEFFLPTEAELAAVPPDRNSDDPVVRGEYLARVQFACVGCHGSNDAGYHGSNPLTSGFQGGEDFSVPDLFNLQAPNLTLVSDWSAEQLEAAIRWGISPEGRPYLPIMGFDLYATMSDQDMADLIAFLQSLEPTGEAAPEPEILVPGMTFEMLHPVVPEDQRPTEFPAPDASDAVARGGYLANTSSCMHCHGQVNEAFVSTPWPDGLPYGWFAPSLLPYNLSRYSDDELRAVITTGVKQDGEMALGMPWPSFRHLPAEDVDALIAWIRALPDVDPSTNPNPPMMPEGGEPAPDATEETSGG